MNLRELFLTILEAEHSRRRCRVYLARAHFSSVIGVDLSPKAPT